MGATSHNKEEAVSGLALGSPAFTLSAFHWAVLPFTMPCVPMAILKLCSITPSAFFPEGRKIMVHTRSRTRSDLYPWWVEHRDFEHVWARRFQIQPSQWNVWPQADYLISLSLQVFNLWSGDSDTHFRVLLTRNTICENAYLSRYKVRIALFVVLQRPCKAG